MTDSITNAAGDQRPPNVQITFRDDLDLDTQPEVRRVVERSVATHLARSEEAVAQVRAAEAERTKLVNALNKPFMKLIEEDPAARKALDDLRTQQLIDLDSTDVSLRAVRQPPYDYSWSWFHQAGSAPFDQLADNATGKVRLDARSGPGSIQGGADGFVEAHAGFGLLLSTDHSVTVTGHSLRIMRYAFQTGAVGLDSNATSEGGMEFTAFEGPQLLTVVSGKMWRNRVSSTFFDEERGDGGEGPTAFFDPSEITFTMNPGHQYTLNAGIWVFSDRSEDVVGAAGAQSFMEGNMFTLWAEIH